MRIRHGSIFAGCERGAAAAEFALLLPALIGVLLGVIWASLLTYSVASLHYAVQGAARCYSVGGQCATASAAQNYAKSRYFGANFPTFTASNATCGHQVTGSVNVAFSLAMGHWNVPLSATACFP
jgi:Flp pilus assembly protein TadG